MSLWLLLAVAGVLLVLIALLKFWRPGGRDYSADWQKIMQLASRPDTASLAVIEADKLLDRVLKDSRYRGETMADRLSDASGVFKDYNAIRRVHRLRNRLVHETGSTASRRQAEGALKVYRRGLKNLGVKKI